MSVATFVATAVKLKQIRSEAAEERKRVVANAKDAENVLTDMLLAAGLESAKANDDYVALVPKRPTPPRLCIRTVEQALENIDEREVRVAVADATLPPPAAGGNNSDDSDEDSGGDGEDDNPRPSARHAQASLLTSLRCFTRSKLASVDAADADDAADAADVADVADDTARRYSIRLQPHMPLRHRAPSARDEAPLQAAVLSFVAADRAKRIFNGRLKDLLDEEAALAEQDGGGRTTAAELAAFEYVAASHPSAAAALAADGGGVAHASVDGSGDGFFLRAKTSKRPRQRVDSKKFMAIVDEAVGEFVLARFGPTTSVDEARLGEVSRHKNEVIKRVQQKMEAGGHEMVRSVCVVDKMGSGKKRRGGEQANA